MVSVQDGHSPMTWLAGGLPLILIGLLMPGCTTYALQADDPTLAHGSNAVTGSARLIYTGRDFVRDCDGEDVYLVPATPDVTSHMTQVFPTTDNGFVSGRMLYEFLDKAHRSISRSTECSDGGKFRFADVPDGRYYVFARIMWLIGHGQNAGNLVSVVTVAHGETKTVELKKVF